MNEWLSERGRRHPVLRARFTRSSSTQNPVPGPASPPEWPQSGTYPSRRPFQAGCLRSAMNGALAPRGCERPTCSNGTPSKVRSKQTNWRSFFRSRILANGAGKGLPGPAEPRTFTIPTVLIFNQPRPSLTKIGLSTGPKTNPEVNFRTASWANLGRL